MAVVARSLGERARLQASMAEGETARQLSFSMEGDAVPDHADVRQLLKQVEQQQAMLASASMVKALDGAEPLAYAQACTRIKDEFSRLKLQLLEQETKKRLLEHLLSKGAKAGSQDSFAEAQMNERKATAKRAKAEGKALREKIAEHARAIAQLKRQIAEEGAALARSADSLAENAEQETAARAQLVATTAELEAVERALATEEQNATLAEEELARLRAQSERDADRRRQLREQIEATRAGVAEAEAELGRRLEEASSLQRASTDAETCARGRAGRWRAGERGRVPSLTRISSAHRRHSSLPALPSVRAARAQAPACVRAAERAGRRPLHQHGGRG